VTKTDPLALLAAIKNVVTSRCDGNIELERAQAPRDWYTLTMHGGEDVVAYGRRSVKINDRLTSSGEPEAQLPSPKSQSLRFIDGLTNSSPTYFGYKNYLSNSLTVTGKDIYPATLVEAINSITKFHRGAKTAQPTNPAGTVYTTLAAVTEEKSRGKPRERNDKKSRPDKVKSTSESSPGGEKEKDWKAKLKCHNCGKLGHLKKECRGKKKDPPTYSRIASAAIADYGDVNNESSFYSTFGQMYDKEDDINYERYCNIALTSTPGATSTLGAKISLPAHQTSIQPDPITTTEVVWDTGATGSIVKTVEILTSCENCDPILYNGLQGSLTIDKVGQLRDIGLVHYDPRAHISILSASECWLQ
jgi:hypothetical protein